MEVKPIDILNKKFERKVRGYNPTEVDEFLREVATAFEKALSDKSALSEQLEDIETELRRYKDIENVLNNSLILAQKTSDEVKANAQKEAELIVREAKDKLENEISQARSRLEDLYRTKERFLIEFRALLRSYTDICGSEDGRRTE